MNVVLFRSLAQSTRPDLCSAQAEQRRNPIGPFCVADAELVQSRVSATRPRPFRFVISKSIIPDQSILELLPSAHGKLKLY